jgi:hypothetical protein
MTEFTGQGCQVRIELRVLSGRDALPGVGEQRVKDEDGEETVPISVICLSGPVAVAP